MRKPGRYGAIWQDGRWRIPIERVWSAVRRWAKRNGYEYQSSFGVVGVGSTDGYTIAFWFHKLRIAFVGTIELDMDETGKWWCAWEPRYCPCCGVERRKGATP